MPKGNQGRRGAQHRTDKQTAIGSGGRNRRALGGHGPTPKAEERTYHVAYQKKAAREREVAAEESRAAAKRHTRVKIRPGRELVVGRGPVLEVVSAGIDIERIFIADSTDGRMREVIAALSDTGAPFVEVTRRDLDVASEGAVHQGIGVEVAEYEYWDLDEILVRALEGSGLLVALDHVTDPHNVGAVLRSSAAFGAAGLILPERRSAGIGVTAWKVSAGAVAKVPSARVTNLVQALQRCKDAGFFVVGLEGEADQNIRDFQRDSEPLVLVTGAEGKGLSRLVAETCDMLLSIPISGMESLNAAVATGIALYELAEAKNDDGVGR